MNKFLNIMLLLLIVSALLMIFSSCKSRKSQSNYSKNDFNEERTVNSNPLTKDFREPEKSDIRKFNFKTKSVILNSGYSMPIAGIGTYGLSNEECFISISSFLESGGRLIDTAHIYGNEKSVGEAIKESNIQREEIFIVTKLYPNQFSDASNAIVESLEKLDTDYIDLLLLHHPGTDDVQAYKVMEQAVTDGKIKSIGLSNWYIEELEGFLPQIKIIPALIQNEIHPFYQDKNVVSYIQDKGIVIQGYYPFGGRGNVEQLFSNPIIKNIATKYNVTPAQVILKWNLQRNIVVIPGSSNPNHIRENLDIFDFILTGNDITEINKLDRNEKNSWY